MFPVFKFGAAGYELYKTIHMNPMNQMVHGIGMPFVALATFIGIPALFGFYRHDALVVSSNIYSIYLLYYLLFDVSGAVVSGVIYFVPLIIAGLYVNHSPYFRWRNVFMSLCILVVALGVQEYVGHTLYEQKNSIIEHIPNSIAIAPLFGARCIFGMA